MRMEKCFSCNEPLYEGETYYFYENTAYCERCFENVLNDIMQELKEDAQNIV